MNYVLGGGNMLIISVLIVYVIALFGIGLINDNLPQKVFTSLLAMSCFLAGILFRRLASYRNVYLGIGLLVGVLLFTLYIGKTYSMLRNLGNETLLYFIISMVGSVGIINICSAIKGRVADFLDYAGVKTLYILIWHFSALKIVSILKIWYYGYDWSMLSEFPVIEQNNAYFWILYSFVGIALPLVGCYAYDSIRLRKSIN